MEEETNWRGKLCYTLDLDVDPDLDLELNHYLDLELIHYLDLEPDVGQNSSNVFDVQGSIITAGCQEDSNVEVQTEGE